MAVQRALLALAACAPVAPRSPRTLAQSLTFLGADVDAETVTAAAVGVVTLAALLSAVAALAPTGGAVLAAGLFAAGTIVAYGLHALPVWLADARRTRALGAAPDLVGLAVLRARVEPTLEGAASFAAEHGRGPLADSLDAHVREAHGTPDAGWSDFAATWRDERGLHRAISLLSAAIEADESDRERLLDRAFTAALDGTRDRMAAFAGAVRGPASAIYAFGVVLPLSLVATLPAARAAGVPVSVGFVVAVYDLLLPAALLAAGAWLLGRRPAAFPPAPVERSHPDVPDRRVAAVAGPLLVAGLSWVAASRFLVPWTRWVATPALAVGTALVVWYRPVMRVRSRVRAVETGFPDALTVVGERLRQGQSPEAAIERAGGVLPDAVGDVFADAARVQRQLRTGPEEAFLGRHGALQTVPSPRVRASAALFALAAREGAHGGHLLAEMADHVEALVSVEQAARRELGSVVGTLRSTACCFAPLIGGVTVALAGRLDGSHLDAGLPPMPTAPLGVAVGAYVLALAVVLVVLATGLDRGLDRSLAAYHAGVACLSAGTIYALVVTVAGALV